MARMLPLQVPFSAYRKGDWTDLMLTFEMQLESPVQSILDYHTDEQPDIQHKTALTLVSPDSVF